jgi:hypothetical protein
MRGRVVGVMRQKQRLPWGRAGRASFPIFLLLLIGQIGYFGHVAGTDEGKMFQT